MPEIETEREIRLQQDIRKLQALVTTLENQVAVLTAGSNDLKQKIMTCAIAMKEARAFIYQKHGKPGAGHELPDEAQQLISHLEDSINALQDDAANRKVERQKRELERLKKRLAAAGETV